MHNKLDAIIFDLDGTLWDTCDTCAKAWNNVVKRNGISFRTIHAEDVKGVAGLPHEQCIRKVFQGLSEPEIQAVVAGTKIEDNIMIEEYGGKLYEGVQEGLACLSRSLPLYIVSNCQLGYIETFLRINKLEAYFRDFECWGNTKKSKAENLGALIARNNLTNCVFVGDTIGDQTAADACNIPFWFVSYGFGRCADASHVFQSFSELVLAVNSEPI